MTRSKAPRAALVVSALFAMSGCARETDFDLTQTFHVVTTGTTFEGVETVSLADQGGGAWDHRNKIRKVSVVSASATITAVNAGSATEVSGTVALRPDGAPADGSEDVPVGSWVSVPIAQGTVVDLQGSPELDGVINTALKGSGVLSFVLDVAADGTTDLDLEARLRVTVEYRVP